VEHLHDLATKEMSKLEHFCTVDLPSFKTLHDSFVQAQSKQPTDLQHILQTVDDRIKENIRKLESKLESLPAAVHVVQMIHDETKIHDLVRSALMMLNALYLTTPRRLQLTSLETSFQQWLTREW
jgi:arsenate reductase-like glutaredoxin family protein